MARAPAKDAPAEGLSAEASAENQTSKSDLLVWLATTHRTVDQGLDTLSKFSDYASVAASSAAPYVPNAPEVGQEVVTPENATIAKLEGELAMANQDNQRLRDELRKARTELTTAKARAVTLSKSIGESSAIVTGTVSTKTAKGDPESVAWTDDLADVAADNQE